MSSLRRRARRIVKWTALAVGVLLVLVAGVAAIVYTRADVNTVGTLRFEQPLRIPPLLEPRTDAAGRKVFDLDLESGNAELLPGTRTETWGVNGPYLGPTLRAARGDTVRMNVRNRLPESTTLHWHGMHLPAVADGGPHQTIGRGAVWSPSWTVDQPAATLWYHPHLGGATEEHVSRGVAGIFIVDDDEASELPHDYGVDDIPVIVQDARFDDDGALELSRGPLSPVGRLGDTMLINGTYAPYLDVRHERVRLRVVNASAGRTYNVGFSDGRGFELVATDGGQLRAPHATIRVQLSPGERAEIVAAFEPGKRVVLRSYEPELGTNLILDRFGGGDDSFDLLEIRAAARLAPSREVPAQLAPAPRSAQPARTRRVELNGRAINGETMDMARIDEVAAPGSTEVWEVRNADATPHNFHLHGVTFRVLELDGSPPPPQLAGPKDTVYVTPGTSMRILIDFPDYADAHHPYMFHCHVLAHEDSGMMGQLLLRR